MCAKCVDQILGMESEKLWESQKNYAFAAAAANQDVLAGAGASQHGWFARSGYF
jgi:hypothetical protein